MTQDEIIRMAREAGWDEHNATYDTRIERFAALVAAHEREKQVEQEPVACELDALSILLLRQERLKAMTEGQSKLYAAPVRTKDLTDDEILKTNKTELPDCQDLVDFARAVIAADREKNNG